MTGKAGKYDDQKELIDELRETITSLKARVRELGESVRIGDLHIDRISIEHRNLLKRKREENPK